MDIAIAGAGIAGLAAASFLRRQGHRVVLYDQLDKPAPIGSGLIIQPTGQAVLSALGLGEALARRGARIDRLFGRAARSGRIALDVGFGDGAYGIGVHRAALFELLFSEALDAGVEFEPAHEVVGVHVGESATLEFSDGRRSPGFDLIVDALGLHSPLVERENLFLDYGALWTNIPLKESTKMMQNTLEQRYEGARKTAGVMPIGAMADGPPLAAFFWSLRRDRFAQWQADGLDTWKEEVLALWPALEAHLAIIQNPEQLVFARYAHHTIQNPVGHRLVHIGDSWHAASPQLGQGANMALLDAYALAKSLDQTTDIDAALGAYKMLRQRHVWLYQTISQLFTPFYQSDSRLLPWLRDYIATPAAQLPPIAAVLSSMVAGNLGLDQSAIKKCACRPA
jgi:2-polyprenyl-6-methoxyphenol hydroxylase-like FAD-dependent oxidoreductase